MSRISRLFPKILLVLIIAAGIVAVYPHRTAIIQSLRNALGGEKPCSQPITYSLGSFDNRFGLSQAQFLNIIATAAGVWNKAAARQLFEYVPTSGSLKINLIYDYRQQATLTMGKLGLVIHDDKASYDILKEKYDSLSAAYASGKAALSVMVSRFQADKAAYDSEVASWNDRGGAPHQEYLVLQQKRQDLEERMALINQAQDSLNQVTDNINATVVVINRLVRELNLNVKTFNAVGSSTGAEFDEGEYVRNSAGIAVNIYQFSDTAKLARVLEHEFGHALGLEHVEDPKAIMYRLNQGSNETLTAADISELKRACQIQ